MREDVPKSKRLPHIGEKVVDAFYEPRSPCRLMAVARVDGRRKRVL